MSSGQRVLTVQEVERRPHLQRRTLSADAGYVNLAGIHVSGRSEQANHVLNVAAIYNPAAATDFGLEVNVSHQTPPVSG